MATVDLAVGLATFRPITASRVEDHRMHEERYTVPEATLEACGRAPARRRGGYDHCARARERRTGRSRWPHRPVHPAPFEFRVVDVLLTNFHMPRSSLLVMLDAFCGPRWRDLYDCALAEGYRFLSFGDAMLVGRGS